jgi:hypothetical protein
VNRRIPSSKAGPVTEGIGELQEDGGITEYLALVLPFRVIVEAPDRLKYELTTGVRA